MFLYPILYFLYFLTLVYLFSSFDLCHTNFNHTILSPPLVISWVFFCYIQVQHLHSNANLLAHHYMPIPIHCLFCAFFASSDHHSGSFISYPVSTCPFHRPIKSSHLWYYTSLNVLHCTGVAVVLKYPCFFFSLTLIISIIFYSIFISLNESSPISSSTSNRYIA